jgi:hypothetical protein
MEQDRFRQLMESALGNVKPLLNEQNSTVDEYDKKYSELSSKFSNLIHDLEQVGAEFEELGEEVYSQIDSYVDDEEGEEGEEDYDKEQMNDELEDIAQSCLVYSDMIYEFITKID